MLSYNLFSMGTLAELGYRITFDYSGCTVQDSTTGQELRTNPRFRHKLEMEMLCDLSSVIYPKQFILCDFHFQTLKKYFRNSNS